MLESSHGFSKATLINDLVATGYAIPHLTQSDLLTINKGIRTEEGGIGIIAPGTGLGEAVFTWEGSRYTPVPSEGGHTDFAPLSEVELDLLAFLNKKHGHVSYDLICSGRGLPRIYDFIKEHLQHEEPDWLIEKLANAEDRAPVGHELRCPRIEDLGACHIRRQQIGGELHATKITLDQT